MEIQIAVGNRLTEIQDELSETKKQNRVAISKVSELDRKIFLREKLKPRDVCRKVEDQSIQVGY